MLVNTWAQIDKAKNKSLELKKKSRNKEHSCSKKNYKTTGILCLLVKSCNSTDISQPPVLGA